MVRRDAPYSFPSISLRAPSNASGSFSGSLPPAWAMPGLPPPDPPTALACAADPVAGVQTPGFQIAGNARHKGDFPSSRLANSAATELTF